MTPEEISELHNTIKFPQPDDSWIRTLNPVVDVAPLSELSASVLNQAKESPLIDLSNLIIPSDRSWLIQDTPIAPKPTIEEELSKIHEELANLNQDNNELRKERKADKKEKEELKEEIEQLKTKPKKEKAKNKPNKDLLKKQKERIDEQQSEIDGLELRMNEAEDVLDIKRNGK